MHPPFSDPRYWNVRAETMRVLAEDVGDPDAKATLLKVAESYQRLAEQRGMSDVAPTEETGAPSAAQPTSDLAHYWRPGAVADAQPE